MSYVRENPEVVTPQLAGMLALRFHALDEMVGINRITPKVQAMLNCYVRLKREQAESVAQAVYLQAVIKAKQTELANLVERIRTGEKIPDAIERAIGIQAGIEEATRLLANLVQ